MRAADLLERHRREWLAATRHPFLDGVRDGTVPEGAFDAWLVQDYLFVRDELGFLSRLVPRGPRRDQGLLIGGLAALEAELGWFEKRARERGASLARARRPATAAYGEFLAGLAEAPYPASITVLWALERAYLEAWRSASPGHPDYREYVEHWTTEEFADYVAALEEVAGRALEKAESAEREQVEGTFLEVARLEREFWEMVFGGERRTVSSGSPYEPTLGISRAVRMGDIVAVSGTAPLGPGGGVVAPGDAAAQARRSLEIICKALEDLGLSVGKVIRTRILLRRIEDWEAVAKVHGEVFGEIRPASTVAQVVRFTDPEILVEIEADAVAGPR